MKRDTEVVMIIVSFFLGAAFIAYAEELSVNKYMDSIVMACATLVAAFFGVSYAYKLESVRLEKRKTKKQVDAGNKATFELVRSYNQFLNIRNQFIEKQRNSPTRHVLILPMMTKTLHTMEFNFDDLAFLFGIDDVDPDLLGYLATLQYNVASTIDLIDQRSLLHREDLQPKIEKLEDEFGEAINLDQIEKALGKKNTQTLRMLTDLMIDQVDNVISNIEKYLDELYNILKQQFPGHRIIGMANIKNIPSQPKNDGADD